MIGQRRHRLTLQSATQTQHGVTREPVLTWAADGVLWASVSQQGGDERTEAARVEANATHVIECRYTTMAVTPQKRFLWGSRVFSIRRVVNVDERDRTLIVLAEEAV
jgi:SPP1 family predicted phage head-tail adaptor